MWCRSMPLPNCPYIFRDLDHVHKVWTGRSGRKSSKQLLDKAKVRTIAVYDTTFRKIFTKPKPINSLADMKGLKIRVPEAQNYMRCMQLLGRQSHTRRVGRAVHVAPDGCGAGLREQVRGRLQRQAPRADEVHGLHRPYLRTANPFLCSERWFSKQPKNVQQAISRRARSSWRGSAPRRRPARRPSSRRSRTPG